MDDKPINPPTPANPSATSGFPVVEHPIDPLSTSPSPQPVPSTTTPPFKAPLNAPKPPSNQPLGSTNLAEGQPQPIPKTETPFAPPPTPPFSGGSSSPTPPPPPVNQDSKELEQKAKQIIGNDSGSPKRGMSNTIKTILGVITLLIVGVGAYFATTRFQIPGIGDVRQQAVEECSQWNNAGKSTCESHDGCDWDGDVGQCSDFDNNQTQCFQNGCGPFNPATNGYCSGDGGGQCTGSNSGCSLFDNQPECQLNECTWSGLDCSSLGQSLCMQNVSNGCLWTPASGSSCEGGTYISEDDGDCVGQSPESCTAVGGVCLPNGEDCFESSIDTCSTGKFCCLQTEDTSCTYPEPAETQFCTTDQQCPGSQTRACLIGDTWAQWGLCVDTPGDNCPVGDDQLPGCNLCRFDVCLPFGTDPGDDCDPNPPANQCNTNSDCNAGVCTPGDEDQIPCMNDICPGSYIRTCDENGQWPGWSAVCVDDPTDTCVPQAACDHFGGVNYDITACGTCNDGNDPQTPGDDGNGFGCANSAPLAHFVCDGLTPSAQGCGYDNGTKIYDGPGPRTFSRDCGMEQIDTAGGHISVFHDEPCDTPPSSPPPGSPPPSSPPGEDLACFELTYTPATPTLGQTVSLACAADNQDLVDHSEFRYKINEGAWVNLGSSQTNQMSLTITASGSYDVQCRVCSSSDSSSCTAYTNIL